MKALFLIFPEMIQNDSGMVSAGFGHENEDNKFHEDIWPSGEQQPRNANSTDYWKYIEHGRYYNFPRRCPTIKLQHLAFQDMAVAGKIENKTEKGTEKETEREK